MGVRNGPKFLVYLLDKRLRRWGFYGSQIAAERAQVGTWKEKSSGET